MMLMLKVDIMYDGGGDDDDGWTWTWVWLWCWRWWWLNMSMTMVLVVMLDIVCWCWQRLSSAKCIMVLVMADHGYEQDDCVDGWSWGWPWYSFRWFDIDDSLYDNREKWIREKECFFVSTHFGELYLQSARFAWIKQTLNLRHFLKFTDSERCNAMRTRNPKSFLQCAVSLIWCQHIRRTRVLCVLLNDFTPRCASQW